MAAYVPVGPTGDYSFDFEAHDPALSMEDIVLAMQPTAPASVPKDYWFVNAIADMDFPPDAGTAGHVLVPNWVLGVACGKAMCKHAASADMATDTIAHATTYAYLLDAAEILSFHLDEDGSPRRWTSFLAFSHDLHAFAQMHFSAHPAAFEFYDIDVVSIHNVAAPAAIAWVDTFTVDRATTHGMHEHQIFLWLIGPVAPAVDFVAPSETNMVLQVLAATAQSAFPAVAAVSTQAAIRKLLAVDVPYQLGLRIPNGAA